MKSKLFLYLVTCLCWFSSQSQQVMQVKSPLQLADQYYAAGEYYTAAYLYEQCLNPAKNNTHTQVIAVYAKKGKQDPIPKNVSREAVLYRQAESYRLAHYYLNADSAYKKCTNNIDALYWSAVCERSLGKYDEAEENIHKYLSDTTNHQFTEEAQKERQTLQYIRKQLAREDTSLAHTQKLNTADSYERGAFAVMPVSGNRYLISSTKADDADIKGVNPNHSHLFFATLKNDSLTGLTAIAPPAAGTLINQGAASISSDGRRIYFTQWKKQNGHTVAAICYIVKQGNGNWSAPQVMQQLNADGYNSQQPFCTADGKYLFFASNRPGGSGGLDIWYAPLNADGSAGEPVNAGAAINTTADEQAPFYQTSSGTLVFSSNGRQGMGSFDLFAAKGGIANWSTPANMGYPVNSSRDDIYFYVPEKKALLANAIVGSDRGCGCCLESWFISKAPKSKRLNGLVRDCKTNGPIDGAEIVLTDSSGKTRKATTDANGKYVFEMIDADNNFTLSVAKPSWQDTTAAVKVIKTDESNLLVDELFNADVCIEKPVEKKFVLKVENVVTVFFDFDKSNLKPDAVSKLDSVYSILLQNPSATLQISGYTDGKGSVDYNKKLSDRRARACADYFIKKGINASRITFESFGACCPLEMELINGRDNPDGRSRNRRALINISKE